MSTPGSRCPECSQIPSTELRARYRKAIGGRPGNGLAGLEIEECTPERMVARAEFEESHARPGGMVAGTVLFTLADAMAYFVTISRSPKGSEAFTTSFTMEFLRPAPVGALTVEGRLLRFGKRSCVIDATIWSAGMVEPVAHAVVTYAPVFPKSTP